MSPALRGWCAAIGSTNPAYIEPGSAWENRHAESFNGRFGNEFLNTDLYTTAQEAEILANRRRWDYNTVRYHLAHQERKPVEAAQAAGA